MSHTPSLTQTLSISEQHPSLPGHFPGQPIVPGVVILSTVFEQLHREWPQWRICGIKKLKFLRPLAAGQGFRVDSGAIKNGELRFKCHCVNSDQIIAEGHLKLQSVAAQQDSPL